MENINNLEEQFRKYLFGEMNETEVREFISYLKKTENSDQVKRTILSILIEIDARHDIAEDSVYEDALVDSLSVIKSKIVKESKRKHIRVLWKRYALTAAVITMILSFSYLLFLNKQTTLPNAKIEKISPGTQSATLTLADGKVISLNDALHGVLANENGVQIVMEEGGQIVYKVTEQLDNNALSFNTLSTSRGESFQMKLPDGTKVWLNAESSITYPSNINAQQGRKVKLVGEGFFDVSNVEDSLFEIETRRGTVQVLGTQFNVSDYPDDKIAHVSLVEGSVKVISLSNDSKLLLPNQQLKTDGNQMLVNPIDVSEIIAWKEGEFMFDKQPLEEIMKSISRWYDIDVEISESLKDMRIWGSISRQDDLNKVLRIMELTDSDIKVKIEGRRVVLMK